MKKNVNKISNSLIFNEIKLTNTFIVASATFKVGNWV